MDVYSLILKEVEKKLATSIDKFYEIPKPEFGDLAITLAFELAKKEGKNPNLIAKELAKKLEGIKFVKKINVVGGYVNLIFDWLAIAKDFLQKELAIPSIGKGEKIIVEHTSVNPNKALHIGHLRNACLGDALARMLSKAGYDVKVLNYIDDTGLQIGYHLLAFKELGYDFEVKKKFDIYASEIYAEIVEKVENSEELKAKAREIIKKLEEGDEEITKLAEKFVRKVLLSQLETLWKFNIFYDLINYESHIILFNLWKEAFELLKQKGFVVKEKEGKHKGCWVIKLSSHPSFENLRETDKVLVRSDGTLVYTAKDIAYAMWKHGILKKDFKYKEFVKQPNGKVLWTTHPEGEAIKGFNQAKTSINVIDVRQSYVQNVVKAIVEAIKKVNYLHYAYEVVALSKGTANLLGIKTNEEFLHMSGRRGIYINADDVFQAVFNKAYEETKKRHAEMSEEKIKEIAKKIATSTIRYELTKIDKSKLIVFDIVESLKLEGHTAPYLQYSYVRAKSLLRKANSWEFEMPTEINEEEIDLLRKMSQFSIVFQKAVNLLDPSIICNYLAEVCDAFNLFYEKHPILKSKQKGFRLAIVKKFVELLDFSFDLIGIEKMEVM